MGRARGGKSSSERSSHSTARVWSDCSRSLTPNSATGRTSSLRVFATISSSRVCSACTAFIRFRSKNASKRRWSRYCRISSRTAATWTFRGLKATSSTFVWKAVATAVPVRPQRSKSRSSGQLSNAFPRYARYGPRRARSASFHRCEHARALAGEAPAAGRALRLLFDAADARAQPPHRARRAAHSLFVPPMLYRLRAGRRGQGEVPADSVAVRAGNGFRSRRRRVGCARDPDRPRVLFLQLAREEDGGLLSQPGRRDGIPPSPRHLARDCRD